MADAKMSKEKTEKMKNFFFLPFFHFFPENFSSSEAKLFSSDKSYFLPHLPSDEIEFLGRKKKHFCLRQCGFDRTFNFEIDFLAAVCPGANELASTGVTTRPDERI
jgi:hypothetical protein